MPSSVATRMTRSARMLVRQAGQHFGACSGSRYDSTMAMICGCSLRMSSATCARVHPLERLEALALAAEADAIDDAGGLFLAERVDQHLAHEFVAADAERGLALHAPW